jgi:hypothetical protein
LDSLLAALKNVDGKVSYLVKINALRDQYEVSENQIGKKFVYLVDSKFLKEKVQEIGATFLTTV